MDFTQSEKNNEKIGMIGIGMMGMASEVIIECITIRFTCHAKASPYARQASLTYACSALLREEI
jgi:hypothetical protein